MYAAPANTSSNRSRTTGDVRELWRTSSSVSRNLREAHCVMNRSVQFRNMIAQSRAADS